MTQPIAVVGLGYVGLPLAVEFARQRPTIGFDVASHKIDLLRNGVDPTNELDDLSLLALPTLQLTDNAADLAQANIIIVAVPTPVDAAHKPDFSPLLSACQLIGPHLAKGATVVFESTVFPGATEEICVPALERASGLSWKTDFHVGYSPERINPGDKEHTLTSIVKVVAGDTPETLDMLADLYGQIVKAGVHKAASIMVAEAAKVIENTQRDLNIALMNELSLIFNRLNIDTMDVLEAAGTKWNFLPFRPGLVGGHCIGVDPYYLTSKAEMVGYTPQVILGGRRINDAMGAYIARQTIKAMIQAGQCVKDQTVVVLGLTFKEDVPDVRNSKVVDVIAELQDHGLNVLVHDPMADKAEAKAEYGVDLVDWEDLPTSGAVIAAVNHRFYLDMPLDDLLNKAEDGAIFVDVKSAFDRQALTQRGISVWRL